MTAAGTSDGRGNASPFGLRDSAVRRCLLAVSVLHDLDLVWDDGRTSEIRAEGSGFPDVRVEGPVPVVVPGPRLALLIGDDASDDPATVERVARFFRLRRCVAQLSPAQVLASLRVVGLPVGHALHPGADWVQQPVPGGALSLGLGLLPDGAVVRDETADLDAPVAAFAAPTPVPIPGGVLEDAGYDPKEIWPRVMRRLEELGTLAVARHRRRPRDPLRPLAEADVVTLLGSRALRAELATEAGTGLAALVVPMRNRGWVSSSAIDPAFGPAAAAATSDEARGFTRPVLVTTDEVVQVPEGGHPLRYLDEQTTGNAVG